MPLTSRPTSRYGAIMARGDDVLRAIDQSRTLRTKSSLEAWMTEHHDAFALRLKERIADWAILCALFEEAKLTDRSGRTPKPETARKTWQRVRQRVAEMRAEEALRPPAQRAAPVESTPSVRHIEPKKPAATPPEAGTTELDRVLSQMGAKSEMTKPLKR